MRAAFLVLFVFSGFYGVLSAQCPEGVLHFVDDASIAAFAKEYPNCTKLDSSLIIGPNDYMESTRISSVDALKNIKEVNGDLRVSKNPWLEDISVLNGIEKIMGNVEIRSSVHAFIGLNNSQVKLIGGDLTYYAGLNSRTERYAFPELIKVGGNLEAYVFDGTEVRFPQLWKVGKTLRIQSWESAITDNEFPSLEYVGRALTVEISYLSRDFKAFRKLKQAESITLHLGAKGRQVFFGDVDSCDHLTLQLGEGSRLSGFYNLHSLKLLKLTKVNQSILSAFDMKD